MLHWYVVLTYSSSSERNSLYCLNILISTSHCTTVHHGLREKHFNYRPADTDAHWKEHDSAKHLLFMAALTHCCASRLSYARSFLLLLFGSTCAWTNYVDSILTWCWEHLFCNSDAPWKIINVKKDLNLSKSRMFRLTGIDWWISLT